MTHKEVAIATGWNSSTWTRWEWEKSLRCPAKKSGCWCLITMHQLKDCTVVFRLWVMKEEANSKQMGRLSHGQDSKWDSTALLGCGWVLWQKLDDKFFRSKKWAGFPDWSAILVPKQFYLQQIPCQQVKRNTETMKPQTQRKISLQAEQWLHWERL